MAESVIKGDTQIESALKIVEMDSTIRKLALDMHDVKVDVKGIFSQIGQLSLAASRFDELLRLINTNSTRSDERWTAHLVTRDMAVLKNEARWEKADEKLDEVGAAVNKQKGAMSIVSLLFAVLIGALATVGTHFLNVGEAERSNNTELIRQNHVEEDRQIQIIANRSRAMEDALILKDPSFRPAQ